jgi:Mitochondrial carrier protein
MHYASFGLDQSVRLVLMGIPQTSYLGLVSRMQTIEPSNTPGVPRPSILSVLRMTVAESGIRSLYTGLTASITRQMTYSLVRLGSYEEIKRRISKEHPPKTGELLMAACVAGALGGIAGNPAGKHNLRLLPLGAQRLMKSQIFC